MAAAESSHETRSAEASDSRHQPIMVRVNGQDVSFTARSSEPLVWALRDIGLTGTKPGCGIGVCGACVVLLDGTATRACMITTGDAGGHDVVTIEGLIGDDADEELHPVQQAFVEAGAPQCGWCMSGQILTAVALLAQSPDPTDAEIDDTMSDVLCRCGAYMRIKAAVRAAVALQADAGMARK
jgi:isoquinoline 1-oxidoreductase alpha subunit